MSSSRIRELNDLFRTGPFYGDWFLTQGLLAKGTSFVVRALNAVQEYEAFTPDSDPHGERDFGSIELDGERVFWKIDYYDRTLTGGSEDPGSVCLTRRVMTIMLASEY